jgi:hypothetical protein
LALEESRHQPKRKKGKKRGKKMKKGVATPYADREAGR